MSAQLPVQKIIQISLAGLMIAQWLPGAWPQVAAPGRWDAPLVQRALRGEADLTDPNVRSQIAALAPELSSAQRQALVHKYYQAIIAGYTDLEAFASIADFAADLSGGDPGEFMEALNVLILDTPVNSLAVLAGPLGRLRHRLHLSLDWIPAYDALLRFGSTGFAADDGSNQVQHFWYTAAFAYSWGRRPAELAARYHEWNAPGLLKYLPGTGQGRGSEMDLGLSAKALDLGRALAEGRLAPSEVGGWLRRQLVQR